MDYQDKNKDDLALQNLLFFQPLKQFRITGGAYYGSKPGFSPTVGMQYINAGKNWFILFASSAESVGGRGHQNGVSS